MKRFSRHLTAIQILLGAHLIIVACSQSSPPPPAQSANLPGKTTTVAMAQSKEEVQEARRNFLVEVLSHDSSQFGQGPDYHDYIRLRITNNSRFRLPCLTVYTKRFHQDGHIISSTRVPTLPVSTLVPGQSVEYDYYPNGNIAPYSKVVVEVEQLISDEDIGFFDEFKAKGSAR